MAEPEVTRMIGAAVAWRIASTSSDRQAVTAARAVQDDLRVRGGELLGGPAGLDGRTGSMMIAATRSG